MSPNQRTGNRFPESLSHAAMSATGWAGVVGEMMNATPQPPPSEDVASVEAAPELEPRSFWAGLAASLGLAHLWTLCIRLIREPEGQMAARSE